MEPPICEVCDERFDPAGDGGLVSFMPTDAGRAFDARGVPGHSPDQGWFCEHHVRAAEAQAPSMTRRDAVRHVRALGIQRPPEPEPDSDSDRALRRVHVPDRDVSQQPVPDVTDPTERRKPVDPKVAARRAEFRARVERRRATKVEHQLGRRARRDSVAKRFRRAAELAAGRLGPADAVPAETREQTSAPGPEPRVKLGTTTTTVEVTWVLTNHTVRFSDRDTAWDAWSGEPGGGDRFQGTIMLEVDDTWIFATYAEDGMVTKLSESGERTPEASDIIDDLIEGLRSPS